MPICVRIFSFVLVGLFPLSAHGQNTANIDLLAQTGWKLAGVGAVKVGNGVRVTVNPGKDTYGWAELRLPVDVAQTPVLRVEVAGANPKAQWTLKVTFPPKQEEWLITDNAQNGTFSFPIGEYLDRYDRGECIVRFFAIGSGASITLKRLELLGGAAGGVTEKISIDEGQPRQTVDGAGGQLDYPLWTVGKEVDRVGSAEIHSVVTGLKTNGASIARVGAYGDVIEAATKNPGDPRLKAVVHHIKTLKANGMKTMFVAWFPTPDTIAKPAKSDAWRDACVASYAAFLEYCAKRGAPISFFELQNEPHVNRQWWTPDFLGSCGLALAKECERRGLPVEIIGPDGMDDEWVAGWVKAMSERAHIVALKSGADKRGTREMTAHQVSAAIARAQSVSPVPRRYWLTEYGCWAWGNPDADRRAENGPTDGIRYGTAMAELTHLYLEAGISCPSIWELVDVRRVDEVGGKATPEPPKRWGMLKYKTEDWRHRAHFDTLGHYDRALQPGTRVYASASTGGLLPTAVRTADGWRIIVFNRFRYAKRAEVRLPEGNWSGRAWWTVTDPGGGTQTYPLDGTAGIDLPPYGIGTLTLGPKTAPRVVNLPPPTEPKAEEPSSVTRVFSDRFDKPAPGKWLSLEADGKAEAVKALPEGETSIVTQPVFGPDLTVRIRAKIAEHGAFEAVFGIAEGRSQRVQIGATSVRLVAVDANVRHDLSNPAAIAFTPDAWHDLLFKRSGDRITLWIDGRFAWDYEDDDLWTAPGHVGIRGAKGRFEEFSIYAKPEPKKQIPTPVRKSKTPANHASIDSERGAYKAVVRAISIFDIPRSFSVEPNWGLKPSATASVHGLPRPRSTPCNGL